MNRTLKLILMFAPLLLFFSAFVIVIHDLRNPDVAADRCAVAAVGTQVWPFRAQGPYIYKHSDNVLHDVALRCDANGILLLNDAQLELTPVKRDEVVDLTIKTYHYLPKRWLLGIHTGRPATSK